MSYLVSRGLLSDRSIPRTLRIRGCEVDIGRNGFLFEGQGHFDDTGQA